MRKMLHCIIIVQIQSKKSLPSHIRHYRHGNILAYRYGNDCDGNDVLMFGALSGASCVTTRYAGYSVMAACTHIRE